MNVLQVNSSARGEASVSSRLASELVSRLAGPADA
jgi:FMN-dependent NADH-azoreductase